MNVALYSRGGPPTPPFPPPLPPGVAHLPPTIPPSGRPKIRFTIPSVPATTTASKRDHRNTGPLQLNPAPISQATQRPLPDISSLLWRGPDREKQDAERKQPASTHSVPNISSLLWHDPKSKYQDTERQPSAATRPIPYFSTLLDNGQDNEQPHAERPQSASPMSSESEASIDDSHPFASTYKTISESRVKMLEREVAKMFADPKYVSRHANSCSLREQAVIHELLAGKYTRAYRRQSRKDAKRLEDAVMDVDSPIPPTNESSDDEVVWSETRPVTATRQPATTPVIDAPPPQALRPEFRDRTQGWYVQCETNRRFAEHLLRRRNKNLRRGRN